MEKNVGNIDRLIRIIIGIVIIAFGVYYKSWWGLIGLLPIFTGAIRFCPLYVPFRIHTP